MSLKFPARGSGLERVNLVVAGVVMLDKTSFQRLLCTSISAGLASIGFGEHCRAGIIDSEAVLPIDLDDHERMKLARLNVILGSNFARDEMA